MVGSVALFFSFAILLISRNGIDTATIVILQPGKLWPRKSELARYVMQKKGGGTNNIPTSPWVIKCEAISPRASNQ